MINDEDLQLENIFSLTEILDEGFSLRVGQKIQRWNRIRQISLTLAVTIGGVIAIKPLIYLLGIIFPIVNNLSLRWSDVPVESLMSMPSLLIPVLSVFVMLFLIPLVEK